MVKSRLRVAVLATIAAVVAVLGAVPEADAAPGPTAVVTSPASDATVSDRFVSIAASVTAGSGAYVVEAALTVQGRTFAQYRFDGAPKSTVALSAQLHTLPADQAPLEFSLMHNFAVLGVQAWVLDSKGQYVESSVVHVTISLPRAYFTQPHDGDLVRMGQSVPWAVTPRTAGDRTLVRVDVYLNGTLVATDTTAPFGGSFTVPGGFYGPQPVGALIEDSAGVTWDTGYSGNVTVQVQQPTLKIEAPAGVAGLIGTKLPVSVALEGVDPSFEPAGGATINADSVITGASLPWSGTVTVASPSAGFSADVDSLGLTARIDVEPLDAPTPVTITAPASDGADAPPQFKAALPTLLPGELPRGSFVIDGVTTLTADVQGGVMTATNPDLPWQAAPGTHTVQALFAGYTSLPDGTTSARRLGSAVTTFRLAPLSLTLTEPTAGALVRGGDPFVTDAPDGTALALYDGAVRVGSCVAGSDRCTIEFFQPLPGPAQLHVEGGQGPAATSAAVPVISGDAIPGLTGLPGPEGLTTPTMISRTATGCVCNNSYTDTYSLDVDDASQPLAWGSPPDYIAAPLALGTGTHHVRVGIELDDGESFQGPDLAVTVPDPGPVPRVGGADRYGTAGGLSASFGTTGPPFVILASGTTFPDALAGAAAAGAYGAQVLLASSKDELSPWTAEEISRLHPQSAIILGGDSQVYPGLDFLVKDEVDGPVARITGRDRYETAALLSSLLYDPGVPVVYVATGLQFPDALSGAALAGARGVPLLMSSPTAVPSSTATELKRLKPASIVVLGGPAVVSDSVVAQLRSYTTGTVSRIYGADRYATSAAIAAQFPGTVPQAFLATGASFADALAAGAVAGSRQEPLLLTAPTGLPAPTAAQLVRLAPSQVVVAGGPVSVPEAVRQQVLDLLFPTGGGALRVPVRASAGPFGDGAAPALSPEDVVRRIAQKAAASGGG